MKTTKYKVMAIDVDGTLVNSSRELTKEVREALLRAQDEFGIRLILASGRPTPGLKSLVEELQMSRYSGYIMPYNGGEVYNCRAKEPIAAYLLPEGIATELHAFAQEHELTILTYDHEHILSDHIDDPYLLKEVEITGMQPRLVENFPADVPERLPKCLIVGPPERIEALEAVARERFAGRVSVFRSAPYFLEIVPEGVHKAASIARLLERLDYDRSELIAIGDSYNDLEMIQFAGLGVAMANAQEPIKACADYVTKSNDEHGVAHMLYKHIFNQHDEAPYTVEEFNSIIPGTLMEALGIRCVEVAKGYIVGTMPVDHRTSQPLGIIHGGANLAFAETMAGFGSLALLEEGEMQVGAQVSGNHVASAMTGDMMRAEARIMHQGRSTHVWSVEIYSQKSGKLIHTARVLNSILKRR